MSCVASAKQDVADGKSIAMTGPPPLPPLEVNLELQTEMKQASQNLFFWIAYCVYGTFILAYAFLVILPQHSQNEDISLVTLTIPILWFLPVVLLKFHRRFATLLALMPVAILWAFFSLVIIMGFFTVLVCGIEYIEGDGSPVFALLGGFVLTFFLFAPLSILTISGTRSLIRCLKKDEPVAADADNGEQRIACGAVSQIQAAAKNSCQWQFFWNLYFAYGLILLTSKILQWEKSQLVYLLWFGPLLLVKFNRRIAVALTLIPIVAMLVDFIFDLKLQYQIVADSGQGYARFDAMGDFFWDGAWSAAFYFMPLSILLISGIRTLIRYFKDAKACHTN